MTNSVECIMVYVLQCAFNNSYVIITHFDVDFVSICQAGSRRMGRHGIVPSVYSSKLNKMLSTQGGHDLDSNIIQQ